MNKLILKTPSYNLMEDVKKNLGVIFHPNTTLDEVVTIIKKEKANVKGTPKASIKVRQSFNSRKGFVGKDEKAKEKKKTDGMADTSDKVSPK